MRPVIEGPPVVPEQQPSSSFTWAGTTAFTPPEWTVKGMWGGRKSVYTWVGQSQVGKSLQYVHLTICLAHGEPYFGMPTKQCGSLVIAYESFEDLAPRYEAAIRARQGGSFKTIPQHPKPVKILPFKDGDPLPITWRRGTGNLSQQDNVKALIDAILAAKHEMSERFPDIELGVVIIDTLTAAFAGTNANEQETATRAVEVLRQIAEATDTIVVGVYHHGKTVGRGAAGSFVWFAGVDGETTFTWKRKEDGIAQMEVSKEKNSRRGKPKLYTVESVTLGIDSYGYSCDYGYIVPVEEPTFVINKKTDKAVTLTTCINSLLARAATKIKLKEGGHVMAVSRRQIITELAAVSCRTEEAVMHDYKDSMKELSGEFDKEKVGRDSWIYKIGSDDDANDGSARQRR